MRGPQPSPRRQGAFESVLPGSFETRSCLRNWTGLLEDLSHQETAFSPGGPCPVVPPRGPCVPFRCPVGQAPCSAPLLSMSHTCLDLRRPPWKCAECEPAHRPLAATDEVAVTPRCSGPQPQVPGAMSPRPPTALPVFSPAWPYPHQGILLLSGALAPETCRPGNVVETWAQDRRPHPLA